MSPCQCGHGQESDPFAPGSPTGSSSTLPTEGCHPIAGEHQVPCANFSILLAAALVFFEDQPARSLVYVALGTEAPLTADNVRELALGLELSGARFLCALRR
uniref:Uncharacterized protein n=1 Tax=Oryza punctata TaxID=4537 RepID=A0A0E0JQ37_ORYPU